MIQVYGHYIFFVDCDFYRHITSLFVSLNAFGFEGLFMTSGLFHFSLCMHLFYISLFNLTLLYHFVLNVLQIKEALDF